MKILLVTAAVLALGSFSSVAVAHDDPDDWRHAQDHQDHGDYHGDEAQVHALAHRFGLADDPYDHARLHEQLDEQHAQFHDEHPGTWHDHYRRRSYQGYYGNGYNSYRHGYRNGYGYSNAYQYSNPGEYSGYRDSPY